MSQTKLRLVPTNDFLIIKKFKGEDKVGSIIIPDVDKFQRRGEVLFAGKRLSQFVDEYEVGDKIIYLTGANEVKLIIDEEEVTVIRRSDVLTKIVE